MKMRIPKCRSLCLAHVCALVALAICSDIHGAAMAPDALAWPESSNETRPWTYWWWMGGAQDKENLTQLLEMYREAGMGGVHIIPIYGVKGFENEFRDFLSQEWMGLLAHTIAEGNRLGLGVDLSTGTGWPFGGPNVIPEDAAQKLEVQRLELDKGARFKFGEPDRVVAVAASAPDGSIVSLSEDARDGTLDWTPPENGWAVYLLRHAGTGQQVKRAAPGGAGHVLNPFDVAALDRYLDRFSEAFAGKPDVRPRAFYHDSFEYYHAQWSADLPETFREGRGYDLLELLPKWLAEPSDDTAARITCDYRHTVAELHLNFIRRWVDWSHTLGIRTRNQAHGAPGNILDLYAAADIPETEIFGATGFPIPGLRLDPDFRGDRPHPLMIKFASSAAHTSGKRLVSAETCTWLAEHFKVSLAQAKPEIDQLFVGGINHIVYHGMAYSPLDDPWPGWLFYASTCFAPTGGLWRDLPALNAYIARCQSVLQSGEPANDLLLYFPIFDIWQSGATGAALRPLQVHNISDWLHCGGLAPVAERLWALGYAFDYVSDDLLRGVRVEAGALHAGEARFHALLLPPCEYMPLTTLDHVLELAKAGATVLSVGGLPAKEPGYANVEERQRTHDERLAALTFAQEDGLDALRLASGRILRSENLDELLDAGGVPRESIAEDGVRFIRRTHPDGYHYFFSNLGAEPIDGWYPLGMPAQSAVLMDPRSESRAGLAALRTTSHGATECYFQLAPGESCILRTFTNQRVDGPLWPYIETADDAARNIDGPWQVTFVEGGPELPAPYETPHLESWTLRGGPAESFAGTARYETNIEMPAGGPADWVLDLGRVCESARIHVNGELVQSLFSFPFRLPIGAYLHDGVNALAVEVTNLAANRIRDMDKRGVDWKKYYDANIVNIQYKPFDASAWELMDSGLIGPVRLLPATETGAGAARRLEDLATIASGWRGKILSETDQSYAGWDVEIGDADNDGRNEVLVTGCPDSRLYLLKHLGDRWETRLLARDLAHRAPAPGMGLVVKVIDLNGDGKNEIVLGTGQEGGTAGPAFCYVFEMDGQSIQRSISAQALMKDSLYTHNAAFFDLDKDGVLEILSAYCGTGEVTRFDADKALTRLEPRQLYLAEGSGEDSFIADIDNDGAVEYLMCDCYREDRARVHVFEFDEQGELIQPPRITIEGYENTKCFNCSIETGDVDNDGKLDLVVAWKPKWGVNCGTILAYKVDQMGAAVSRTFAREDPELDLGYGEKMMCVADADNDGSNDLVVSTRGEPPWNGNGLGHVFLFNVGTDGQVERTLLLDFDSGKADACWPAVGDADNDGKNEIVVATGVGNREQVGVSHIVLIEKE